METETDALVGCLAHVKEGHILSPLYERCNGQRQERTNAAPFFTLPLACRIHAVIDIRASGRRRIRLIKFRVCLSDPIIQGVSLTP